LVRHFSFCVVHYVVFWKIYKSSCLFFIRFA
jgi:hypothetical protein